MALQNQANMKLVVADLIKYLQNSVFQCEITEKFKNIESKFDIEKLEVSSRFYVA